LRLQEYNYSGNGSYFITICTHGNRSLFGSVSGGQMHLNIHGFAVQKHIHRLNSLHDGIEVDKYVIMPNHLHLIITICHDSINCSQMPSPSKAQIPKMIQAFKAAVTKELSRITEGGTHAMRSLQFPVWQKSYHDHIIRTPLEYQEIWQYIDTNPLKWEKDRYYDDGVLD